MTARKRTYFARRPPMIAEKAIYNNYAALETAVAQLIQRQDLKLARRIIAPARDRCQSWYCCAGDTLYNIPGHVDCPYKVSAFGLDDGTWLVGKFERHHVWELEQMTEENDSSDSEEQPPPILIQHVDNVAGPSTSSVETADLVMLSVEDVPFTPLIDTAPDGPDSIESESHDVDNTNLAEGSLYSQDQTPSSPSENRRALPDITTAVQALSCSDEVEEASSTPRFQSPIDEMVNHDVQTDLSADAASPIQDKALSISNDDHVPAPDLNAATETEDHFETPMNLSGALSPGGLDDFLAAAERCAQSATLSCSAPSVSLSFDLERDDPLHIISKAARPCSAKAAWESSSSPPLHPCQAAVDGLSTFQADTAYMRPLPQDLIAMPVQITQFTGCFLPATHAAKPMEVDECSTPEASPEQREVMTFTAIGALPSPPPTPTSFPDIDVAGEGDFPYSDYLVFSPEPKSSPLQNFPNFELGESTASVVDLDVMEEVSKMLQRHPSMSAQGSPVVDKHLLAVDAISKADRVSNASSELTSLASLDGCSMTSIAASTDVPVPPYGEMDTSDEQPEFTPAQICNSCKSKQRATEMVKCTGKHDKPQWVHRGCMSASERSVLMFKTEQGWLCKRCDSHIVEDTQDLVESMPLARGEYTRILELSSKLEISASLSGRAMTEEQPGMMFDGCYIPPEEPERRASKRLCKRKFEEIVERPKKKVALAKEAIKPKPAHKASSRLVIPEASSKASKKAKKAVAEEDSGSEPVITVSAGVRGLSRKRKQANEDPQEHITVNQKLREPSPALQLTIKPEVWDISELPPTPCTSGSRSLSPAALQPGPTFDLADYPESVQEALKRTGIVDNAAFQALQLDESDITAFIHYLENVDDAGEEDSDCEQDDADMEQNDVSQSDGAEKDDDGAEENEADEAEENEEEQEEEEEEDDRPSPDTIEIWQAKNTMACTIAESWRRGDLGDHLYSLLPRASVQALKEMGIDSRTHLLSRFGRESTEAFVADASAFVKEGHMGIVNAATRWLTLRRILQMYDWEYMDGTTDSTTLSEVWAFRQRWPIWQKLAIWGRFPVGTRANAISD